MWPFKEPEVVDNTRRDFLAELVIHRIPNRSKYWLNKMPITSDIKAIPEAHAATKKSARILRHIRRMYSLQLDAQEELRRLNG